MSVEVHIPTPEWHATDARTPTRDTLTIRRLLLFTATTALGFWLAPPESFAPAESDFWKWLWWLSLFGVSLAGPIVVVGPLRRGASLGLAAHYWLHVGIGGWLFVPGLFYARLMQKSFKSLPACLLYTQSLVSLWLIVSLVLVGQLTPSRLWKRGPWTEHFGLWLAVAWAPLGAWITYDLYREVIP